MKKLSAIFLVCLLVLVGCGAGGGQSKDEGLVLDYINTFVNGTDVDAKTKFVEENVHPDIKPLFALGQNNVTDESKMYKDPKVMESIDYEESGKKGTLVLARGTVDGKEKEIIVLVMEGKIGFGFTPDGEGELKTGYDEMRAKFKTEPLK
ncbi:hypothetical protein [Paenibacillus dendritiformis]|uniref:Lipoprotein n=1 Tax=Paenibacillus dendritiformis C454 TaxID=1131935 RepID=H3SBP7_9BACL|nr:hypothetical protein [Paenibacillus dendritiformis]EHQ63411.1 hypothetical protein PDENDC454_04666 [Paenibacillus dendritiformis C454]CAH8771335.1 hypothetical protein H7S4_004070 [Paenibacillus dendritiformis]